VWYCVGMGLGWTEALRIGWKSLVRHPGRSGLTVLGLAIGVAAFIAMVSFGQGARSSVVEQFEKLGVNVLTVRAEPTGLGEKPSKPLSEADVRALKSEATLFEAVVPIRRRGMVMTAQGRQYSGEVYGTTPEFVDLMDWRFRAGGRFEEADVLQRSKVCLIGQTPKEALFGSGSAIGEVFTINKKLRCRIIGVLAPKGLATSGRDLDDLVITPYSTYRTYAYGQTSKFYEIKMRPIEGVSRAAAEREIASILRRQHALGPNEPDDFWVRSSDEAARAADRVASILTGLLAGIAGVSLLVGGIGIMNIQLVAVAERTQEIGIRSAIGAAPQQILLQFLLEAILLAAVGTAIGAMVGSGLAVAVAEVMRWDAGVPLTAILGAVAFGASVGVAFGYLPARMAARLDPIVALRRE